MKKIALLLTVACVVLTACNNTNNAVQNDTIPNFIREDFDGTEFAFEDFAKIDGSTVIIPLA